MFLPVVISISIILFFLSFFWGNETNSFNSRTLAHQNFKFLSHSFTSTSTSSYSRGSSRKFKRTTATTMSSTIKNYSESLQVHNSLFICCCRFNKWKFMDDNIFFTLWDDALWCPYGWFWTFWFFTINK